MNVKFTVKVFCNNNATNCEVSNVEHLLSDFILQTFHKPVTSTFDSISHECAKICGITPLYFPLFALHDATNNNWIKPCALLSEYTTKTSPASIPIEIEFRVRFHFKTEVDGQHAHRCSSFDQYHKPVHNDKVTTYLFHQRRSDFLRGKLKLNDSLKDKMGAALGVAVLDLLRLARETGSDLLRVRHQGAHYKKLLPDSCRKELSNMNYINRFRVRMKFQHYLQHIADACNNWLNSETKGVAYFYCKYLRNLEMAVEHDVAEIYDILPQSDVGGNYVKVSIGADCGIVKVDVSGEEEQWCDFRDVVDVTMRAQPDTDANTIWLVNISQLNGTLLSLCLSSLNEAENLASCVDGYYQLLADAHHYLCKDVASPSLVERLSYSCHGPITSSFAEGLIRKQPNVEVGDCLLRLSQERSDEYFINTVVQTMPEIIIKNYKLDRQDGMLGIFGTPPSHTHEDLPSLIEAYIDGNLIGGAVQVPFQIDRRIHPSRKEVSTLTIYRCSDAHGENSNLDADTCHFSTTAIIMQRDYSYLKHLGNGRFTEVMLHASRSSRDHKVVLKQVYDLQEFGQKQRVDESFQEAMYTLNFFTNAYIIQQIGTMKNMMVLEYVPYGSITAYLENEELRGREREWSSWFLYVLWQLAHACNYLEEKDCAHGNIRGKNVLLWHDLPRPHIKLSDPGVRTCSRIVDHQVTSEPEPVLPAPWLACEFCNVDEQKRPEWKPTVNGDKWSFATTACEICEWGSLSVEQATAYNLTDDMKHNYVTSNVMNIPEALNDASVFQVNNLIKQCWNFDPMKRPPFIQILRELGSVLTSDYIIHVPRAVENTDTAFNIPDLRTYQDEMLMRIKPLGFGHFGHVDLYYYDYRNGRTEQVAVKTLRRKNSPKMTQEFNNEIETMRRINNPYVVKLKGVAEPSLRIVMEYVQHGSLMQHLLAQKSGNVPLTKLHPSLLGFANQIALGMLALQEKRLIHRDLALRNILLARDSPDTPFYIKISDFGLSRILKENADCYVGNPDEFPIQWYAPECLRNDGQNAFHFQSDVWSYGVTVWEMFSYGDRPVYDALPVITLNNWSRLHDLLKQGTRLPRPVHCPENVYKVITECWRYEPADRISFEDLRQRFDELRKSNN